MQKWVDLCCRVIQRPLCHLTRNLWLSWWGSPPFCSSMEACRGESMDWLEPSSNPHISKLKSLKKWRVIFRNQWGLGEMITPFSSRMKQKMLASSPPLSHFATKVRAPNRQEKRRKEKQRKMTTPREKEWMESLEDSQKPELSVGGIHNNFT